MTTNNKTKSETLPIDYMLRLLIDGGDLCSSDREILAKSIRMAFSELAAAKALIQDILRVVPCGNITTHTPENIADRISDFVEAYAVSDSENERLQAENERLTRERDEAIIKYTGQADEAERLYKIQIARTENLRAKLANAMKRLEAQSNDLTSVYLSGYHKRDDEVAELKRNLEIATKAVNTLMDEKYERQHPTPTP